MCLEILVVWLSKSHGGSDAKARHAISAQEIRLQACRERFHKPEVRRQSLIQATLSARRHSASIQAILLTTVLEDNAWTGCRGVQRVCTR
jgi:hypothetical protein